MHTALTVLFVFSIVLCVVPMAVLPLTGRRALRAGNGQEAARLARDTQMAGAASLLVAALGVGVIGTHEVSSAHSVVMSPASPEQLRADAISALNAAELLSFGVDWIWASIALYVAALLVSVLVVVPALWQSGVAVSENRADGARALYGRLATGSELVLAVLALAAVLLFWQP